MEVRKVDLRLMQVMAGAAHGGAELFFERLALALHRAGIQQHVLIRGHSGRMDRLRQGGLRPVEMSFGGWADVGTRWKFRQEIQRFRPSVIMTWMNRASRFCPAKSSRLPFFIHVGRLGGYYDLKYYRHCDYLICNTEDLVRYVVQQGWSSEKVFYIPNFVEASGADPFPRRDLYTSETVSLIFALGRLHVNKGFDTLLKAVARLPETNLWLAGEGPERASLEKLAHELGIRPRVRFLGWRDDVAALHAAADLFVCPSRHEPLGNVVLEAWAQGKAVLATDSRGPASLITHDRNGLLCPVDDPVALAEQIRSVLRDTERLTRLGAEGRASFEAEFTEAKGVQRFVDCFQTIWAASGQKV